MRDGKTIAPEIEAEIFTYLKTLEEMTGKTFGSKENPSWCRSAPAPALPCPA